MGFLGLMRRDGREPWDVPGYKRAKCQVYLEGVQLKIPEMVLFDPVEKPGYGIIASWGVFDQETGGEALIVCPCEVELDAYEGTIPFVREGTLYMGVDVSSQVKVTLMDACGAGGM